VSEGPPVSDPGTRTALGESSDGRDDLSHLRHELRTPLNQIIGYSEMLEEDAAQAGLTQFVADLQKIQRAAHDLLATINRELVPERGTSARPQNRVSEDVTRPASMSASAARLDGRVLVVDDNDVNRDMLAQRLERHGCAVAVADSGARALESIQSQPFDLVLLDVMMPELDGEAVLRRLKADPATRDLPVVMISAVDDIERVARCIEMGAEDYLPKPCDPALLRARVGASLEKKSLRDRERQAHQALVESQKQLAIELADAADYVESLLPAPLTGTVSAEWRFIPSTSLGGDAFGYHWLDEDHLAIYLLDTCGHGVGTALLSASAINVLRSQSLPGTDFHHPAEVLTGLNGAFQMEKQNNLFFTIWYGVYQASNRRLDYSSGGHPPAVLVRPGSAEAPSAVTLGALHMPIGLFPEATYATGRCDVPAGSRLFVYSDGAYEIQREDGEMWPFENFVEHVAQLPGAGESDLDRLVNYARNLHGRPDFDDDLSIMRIVFH
jgi:phosphoserine phosphatase RsbU/P